ncbi:chorismate lyase [Burkholderiaceae bacterium DAT-1]|nr:chorismate lyase [Burkholderiaceae bacterium DAT-1]
MLHKHEARWTHPAFRAPIHMQDWLTDPASLTAKLKQRFPAFRVQLIHQTVGHPFEDEFRLISASAREPAIVRDVVLMSGDTPLVFAHSVMVRDALRLGFRHVAGQGTRPLGATLFANPKVRRGILTFSRIDPRHPLWHAAKHAVPDLVKPLWARRSCFTLGAARLLVTELFLPAIDHAD